MNSNLGGSLNPLATKNASNQNIFSYKDNNFTYSAPEIFKDDYKVATLVIFQ